MNISMIGIDHNHAPIDVRAEFSFTRKNAGEAMERMKAMEGIEGCVILSTCNRLEVWATVEDPEVPLYDYLCDVKGVEQGLSRECFVQRRDKEAVEHLFYLTSGLKSQILGEDQILTQVKDALTLSREHFGTDSVMEVLFRMAVTAGKKIKTEVPFAHGNSSVIHKALSELEKEGYSVRDKVCMVIGNGEMGKVTAQTLMEAGADVSVTVRQYRSGIVDIPFGCKRLNYTDRMEYLPKCDLVVSATASPNYTLRQEQFEDLILSKPLVLIDLAVPRDIETGIGEKEGITLYDMDSFDSADALEGQQESLNAAGEIVQSQMSEFYDWYDGRDVVPRIQEIREEAVEDLNLRIQKTLQKTKMDEKDREQLLKTFDQAAGKVLTKLLFGLKENLNPGTFLECIEGLEKIYED